MGIVAGSERWILEAALNVDHQQRTLPDHGLTLPRSRFLTCISGGMAWPARALAPVV
jgi:hypothetical protein